MSKKNDPFAIPYRLETEIDILSAADADLLGVYKDHRVMHAVAKRVQLSCPEAFRLARKHVTGTFSQLKEIRVSASSLSHEKIAGMDLLESFHNIERQVGWALRMAEHDSLFDCLKTISLENPHKFGISSENGRPVSRLESMLRIRRLIRQELLAYLRTGRPKGMTAENLKRLIAAMAVFDHRNEDILTAFRLVLAREGDDALYQHSCAELLFGRIPRAVRDILSTDLKPVRERFITKLGRLGLEGRERAALVAYFGSKIDQEEVIPALDRIDAVSKTMFWQKEDVRSRLHHLILALKRQVSLAPDLYRNLFLDRTTQGLQSLHKPVKVLGAKVNYTDTVKKRFVRAVKLDFYPTKDYFDLKRGKFSEDCIGLSLAESQLRTPEFFNIRIFHDNHWIGNIYMLDLTKQCGVVLVDRIQIPREINAEDLDFFERLTEVFAGMLEPAGVGCILTPLRISNHATIQDLYNRHRKKLGKREISVTGIPKKRFESVTQKEAYDVLWEGKSPKV